MNPRYKIGMRNIKTALSVGICLLFFQMLGTSDGLQASITAVICMKSSLQNSIQTGAERITGTAVGAALGVLTVLAMKGMPYWISSVAVIFGVTLIIYLCNIFKVQASTVISIVVFLIILIGKEEMPPILYGFIRLTETIFGIAAAYIINRFIDLRNITKKKEANIRTNSINQAQKEDLPQIMALWLRENSRAHDFLGDVYWHNLYDKTREKYSDPEGTFVWKEDDIVFGYVRLENDTVIDSLCVRKEYQNKGIAKELLNLCKSMRPNLSVHIYVQNDKAFEFFIRQGFYVSGKNHAGDEKTDTYLMEWSMKS